LGLNVSPLGDYHFVVKGTGSSADVTLDTAKGAGISVYPAPSTSTAKHKPPKVNKINWVIF